MDPVRVNTVSNFIESALKRSLASALVINESFLQEVFTISNKQDAKSRLVIFFIKTNLQ